jgi:ATP-binding cassette subfamily B protein
MRFPFFKQLDAMDCGPSCLRMIAGYYGRSYSLQQVRSLTYSSREGVSMLGLSDAAENMGFRSRGVRLGWEQLRDEVSLPCVIHWNQNHFVVVTEISRKGRFSFFSKKKGGDEVIQVADPAHGIIKYNKTEFLKCWMAKGSEGFALLLEPTSEFYNEEPEKLKSRRYSYLLGYLRPYRKFIVQLLLGMLTGSFVSMIFPFLTQSIVDYGIGNSDINFIGMVLVAQLILTFGQTANEMIRNWIMLHITTRVSISLISDFLIKLMRLPISFFDSRMVGDIMQRMEDHGRIQTFLTSSLVNILFAAITLVIYTVIMATYHPLILAVFFAGSILYIGWILLFLKERRTLDYKHFQQSSANQSNVIQLITGMQEIKLNNCEKQKRWDWERIQAKLYKLDIRGLLLNQNQFAGATFINQTKDIIISFLTARAVVTGDMTLGMMMAVQYIIGQLNAPIQMFIGFIQSAQDAKISLERLGEINEKEAEEKPEEPKIKDIPKGREIVLKDVTFQYEGPNSPKVLKDINLEIPANKVTAIVGTSGSGKSTLVKLILGFYNPVKGEISLGGVSLDSYSRQQWRKKCGVVMQEGFIFSDTITGNIGIGDDVPDSEKIEMAVKMANIQAFIGTLPLGYATRIGSDGHGLSTGQKQRILIARSVYKNPDYIFFDEATNALDARNELVIMENLDKFFRSRTVIVVAHRLSTVKNADQIVVLEEGEIVERGTHIELVSRKGVYFNLVKDQLELGT